MSTSMTRPEIITLANQARTDLKVARGAFRRLALENGYKGMAGGWIYDTTRPGPVAVTQGWQALADLVARGGVRFVVTEGRAAQDQRAARAEAELEATDADEPAAPIRRSDIVVRVGEPDGPRGVVHDVATYSTGTWARVSFSGLTPINVRVENLERVQPAAPSPLQAAIDQHVAKRTAATRHGVMRLARERLAAGEIRTATVGDNDARIFATGDRYAVELRRAGEVLFAFSGTHDDERDALRSFTAAVILLTK